MLEVWTVLDARYPLLTPRYFHYSLGPESGEGINFGGAAGRDQ
jgi:hypothetical protein